jgi:hypothetical protein
MHYACACTYALHDGFAHDGGFGIGVCRCRGRLLESASLCLLWRGPGISIVPIAFCGLLDG